MGVKLYKSQVQSPRVRAKGLQNLMHKILLDNMEPDEVQFNEVMGFSYCNFNGLNVSILQEDSGIDTKGVNIAEHSVF